ncbi:MAG: transketolase, partial [Clostridia bacterium]|nr:transketolase [Clostridia bacterium]
KGHAAPALYAALAERGYFDKEILKTLRKQGSILQGHPDRKHIPGVDVSTGSLGQGISAAVGIALYGKINNKDYRTYAIVGDGEMQEGEVYEALMSAAHYGLTNLTVILDRNGLQIDGNVDDVMSISPVKEKAEAFNFQVIEADGHDVESLIAALDAARADNTKPTFIIAKTVKGKGVSFMENNAGWHGKAPNDEQYAQAIEELTKEAK